MANSEAMTLIFLIKKRKEKKFYNGWKSELKLILKLRLKSEWKNYLLLNKIITI